METTLNSLLNDWHSWAATADKSSDGWQSDYPRWAELMQAATAAMEANHNDVCSIEECWLLSEEDEVLAEQVAIRPSRYMSLLSKLAKSIYPNVRWQVYASLENADQTAVPMLENGSTDPDPYTRRRAILALARVQPSKVIHKIDEFCNDPEPNNRAVFLKLKDELLPTSR